MPVGSLPDIFISTREAAHVLGCGPHTIETGLRNGSFPIGWAWCSEEENRPGQWNYRIPRVAFFRAIETGNLYSGDEVPNTYISCRLYNIWSNMKQYCKNPNCPKYVVYGGRGIEYCAEWEQFTVFERWAYENGYREYLMLGRKNLHLGFFPENCFWDTYKEPTNNLRYASVSI